MEISGLGAPNPYRPGKDPEAAEAEMRHDQQLVDHVCGGGCGCAVGSLGGADPLEFLERRDAEVRTHEQEHYSQAGEFARGGPKFETITASNGKTYAVGGHVEICVSEVAGDPAKTLAKMQAIQRAALAPLMPSAQDRKVASEAAAKEAETAQKIKHTELGWNLRP